MRILEIVVAAGVLIGSQAVGVAHAQFSGMNPHDKAAAEAGEPSPEGPSGSNWYSNQRYHFNVGRPNAVVREGQEALKAEGFYNGPVDGVWSPEFREAIWAFQKSKGLPKNARLDRMTREALGMGGDAVYASPPSYGRVPERAAPPVVDAQAP
jgi:peptidoglycan hydrolase-like protein with peptidoglycan-binding domain